MEKINRLKKLLNYYKLDGYIIPKNDEFFGEYIPENKDRLKFISNFSGSYGFALIIKNKNYLFVDGRYTLQANIQSGKLFKIITIPEKLPFDIIKKVNLNIGFDPKIHTQKNLKTFFYKTNCNFLPIAHNLIDKIWIRKDSNKTKKFYLLPKKAIGQSYKSKINKLISILDRKKINFQFISSSENIAWLLNIRGQDSDFTPMPNSYLSIDVNKKINLFCDLKKIDFRFKKKFRNINIIDIKNTSLFLSRVKNKKVLLDSSSCSIYFENIINKNNKILSFLDPIYLLKSIKSKNEIENTIQSHIKDGAALTKFLIWLKKNYKKTNISEITAQEKLLKFRKKNKSFKFLSFPTISGSGPNSAIIHYKADKKSNRLLTKGDVYLVDSGGQYSFGTTDVTRTLSLDVKNRKIKEIFTRVLKGHIAVATYKLKKDSFGAKIDEVARKYLKDIKLDYPHGTGHGVGYFSNVHEGPQAISKGNKVKFKAGMIISNEPGYYKKNDFGIRIENLIYVKKNRNKLMFENLTLAPIDKTLIEKKLLTKLERNWLNNYHKNVFDNLKKFMSSFELRQLKQACSNI